MAKNSERHSAAQSHRNRKVFEQFALTESSCVCGLGDLKVFGSFTTFLWKEHIPTTFNEKRRPHWVFWGVFCLFLADIGVNSSYLMLIWCKYGFKGFWQFYHIYLKGAHPKNFQWKEEATLSVLRCILPVCGRYWCLFIIFNAYMMYIWI